MSFPVTGELVPHRGNGFSTWLAQSAMRVAGWRFDGNLPNMRKMVIVVAPHTSNWDFFIGIAAVFSLKLQLRFLIKHTVFWWPAGPILSWLGGIPIDRTAAHGVVAQAVEDFAKRDELALAITPEGTRRRGVQWKTGFYQIALGAGVPMVPATFDYLGRVIYLGPPLTPSGNADADIAKLKAYCVGDGKTTAAHAVTT